MLRLMKAISNKEEEMFMVKLDNKVAIVTGAASGMGREVATRLSTLGAKVAAIDMNNEKGNEVVEEMKAAGREAIFLQANVTDPQEVKNYVEETMAHFGRVDLFYNNAGIVGSSAMTAEISDSQISDTIDINLKGVLYGLKYVIQAMEKSGGGAIVNTASGAGLEGTPSLIAYGSSKHGVVGATKTAALEYADKNIRINAIAPGSIKTPMIENIDPKQQKEIEASIPIKRQGTVIEIADLVVYLLGDEVSYITGAVIPIDGGYTA